MATVPITFSRLQIEGWRQFGLIDIELHPSVTIITGANGAGKSTILNVFSQHFGYTRPYLGTPYRDERTGAYKYLSGIGDFFRKLFPAQNSSGHQQLGSLTYSNRQSAVLQVEREGSLQYNLSMAGQQAVQGFHVPSHRRLPNYQAVGTIPTQPMLPQQVYSQYHSEVINFFSGGHTGSSPTYRIKEALLSMAVFGPGNAFVQRNPVLIATFEGFVKTLRTLLPEEVGFEDISIRSPDVVLVTKSGEFLIDASSGGLMALVDLAWQIYMFSQTTASFVVTIDEPENHLHPSMQRSLLGSLVKAFPNVQFIVATHSPFIVSAIKDARVYVLRHEERPDVVERAQKLNSSQKRFVSSTFLDSVNRAGTASQILRDVLGLPTTYADWVLEGMNGILAKYRGEAITDQLLISMRKELVDAGFGSLYPDAVSEMVAPQ